MAATAPETDSGFRPGPAMAEADGGRPAGAFQSDAANVLADVQRAFSQVLATLGVRRPVELQKQLQLDRKLSWQICKVAADTGGLLTGPSIPSRVYVTRFIDGAAAAGVPAEQVRFLSATYDRFEDLVQRHAGDRTSFNSLVSAAADATAGVTDDWAATDLQHRRSMFRGECHVMGVHARTRVVSALFERTEGAECRFLFVTGYVGVRVLRPVERVRIHGSRVRRDRTGPPLAARRHGPLSVGAAGSFLIDDFSTRPLPPVQVDHGGEGENQWTQTSLVRPEIGNVGLSTMMFGEEFLLNCLPDRFNTGVTLPVEVVLMDLFVGPGVCDGPPTLTVFRGDDTVTDRMPDVVPLLGEHKVRSLGKGTSNLSTADVPRYPELIRAAAVDLLHDIETFDVWRVRIEYPVYQSTVRLYLPDAMHRTVPGTATA